MENKKRKIWSEEEINNYLQEPYYVGPEMKNIDMHNHTTGSDGDDSPLLLLYRAHKMGLKTISITDHDSIKGYEILISQIDKYLKFYEEVNTRTDLTQEDIIKRKNGARRLLRTLEETKIIPGYEVKTCFEGCPYLEILAYGVDVFALEEKLKTIKANLKKSSPSAVISKELTTIVEDNHKNNKESDWIIADLFYMQNNKDYQKLFIHELMKNPGNAFLYDTIAGKTEEGKVASFEKDCIEIQCGNKVLKVDLSDKNKNNRKNDMINMVKELKEMYAKEGRKLVFDEEILKKAGGAATQFYYELRKHPENDHLIDNRINSQRDFNYLGLYNKNSIFYVNLEDTKPSIEDVVKAIHESGGIALLAHWGRYIRSNPEVFDWTTEEGRNNLITVIKMCDGSECAYPDNPEKLRKMIYDICKDKRKIISIGGDFHGVKGKEGEQYQIGSQSMRNVEQLKWIKKLLDEKRDFISMIENKNHFIERLKKIVEKNKDKNITMNEESR